MKKFVLWCSVLCVMALMISVNSAHAQLQLWVSPNGTDANGCSQTAPCATFQGAINKGNVNQISCLSSGSYGSFAVTASITIDCGAGNVGNVAVSGSSAITIVNGAAATVVLRHLNLNGVGTATTGIDASAFTSGRLIVEDCQIHGFQNGNGILFSPTAPSNLQVSNSQIFANSNGITIDPALSSGGAGASVSFNRVELISNANLGLNMIGNVVAGVIRDSVVAENGTTGIFADATQVFFTVERSSIVANTATGILVNTSGSLVNVSESTISANTTGVGVTAQGAGGSLISFGNNVLNGNFHDGSFTTTMALR